MTPKCSLGAGDIYQRAQAYVGLPYAQHGRTRDGVDCYGLAKLFYMEELGIELPDYSYAQCTRTEHALLIATHMHDIVQPIAAADAVPGDLLLMRFGNSAMHIALYIGYGAILHASSATNARISRLTDMEGVRTLASRIEGWYRCLCT